MLRSTVLALTLVGAFSASAHATGLKATQSVDVATVVVEADGSESTTFSPATDVEPGEQVRYSLTYANEGAAPAENVTLVMPVPGEVTYIEASAAGSADAVLYSADAGENFASRDALTIGAGEETRIASAEEITHIKWVFAEPISPSATGTISYNAVLK
ncbi:MAG: hypothetical protein ABJH52_15920 [Henriciella sp.]